MGDHSHSRQCRRLEGTPSSLECFATATRSPADENQRQPRLETDLPPVDEKIRRLATRLVQNPNDVGGWRTLGWAYANIGHFSEAAEAYAKAIELSPRAAEIRSARIEVLVKSADGALTADGSQHQEAHLIQRIGWLRAAILGANDGIVSTASLVVGVAAGTDSASQVLLAGAAGLVAGAASMAAGEYLSVSSQADTEQADIAREKGELTQQPEFELQELTRIYIDRGIEPALATGVSTNDGSERLGRAR